MNFRNGQWVLFDCDLPEAHHARDGRVVGIYRQATTDPITREAVPAQVVPARPNGCNVRRLDGDNQAVLVAFDPHTLARLEPLADRDDLPPGRQVADCWEP